MRRNISLLRKVGRIVIFIVSILLVCTFFIVGVLFVRSPGKPSPFLDESGEELANSLSEKISVEINGIEQGMFITGKDISNPVLLFVHGGPGMPEFFLAEKYPTGLEDYFTICWWEQRGGGLSYDSEITGESITMEQLISDTLEVTNYLRERFGQEKIYLMGHSWGTFIGIQAAARAPEQYYAYIGISQICQQIESEKLAYEYMLEQYIAAGNLKMVKKLEAYSVLESDAQLLEYTSSLLRDQAMHDLGIGTMHEMKSVLTGIFMPVMKCPAYTLREKINIWRGKAFLKSATKLSDQMYLKDLTVEIPKLGIPTYFISGIYDYTVSYTLSEEYFEKLQAPIKGFYTFNQSAHCPNFEAPMKFLDIMKEDVLNGTTSLADIR